jgi:hypothetical protein
VKAADFHLTGETIADRNPMKDGARCFVTAALTMLALLLVLAPAKNVYAATIFLPALQVAQKPTFTLVQPDPTKTGEWWQWIARLENGPISETGDVDCSTGQTGDTWFLAGTQGNASVVRNCAVPATKTFLAPVYVAAWDNAVGENLTVEEKFKVLEDIYSDQVPGDLNSELCGLESSIDGVAVPTVHVLSPPFQLRLDPEAVSDGYWFAFQVLAGQHQIHFVGKLCDFGTRNVQSQVDVTYNLTVQ